ncbi:uncharacterized protein LOC124636898 [Helicoverpa zea]|uniref:uncharacterized protein LOC124636898 n=1 Tax=Helicoverpa zea TaxID=7113 RepID=UPI001F584BE2|nr:uncharacterized protein LOC124636898 [Helicoverpa zea]
MPVWSKDMIKLIGLIRERRFLYDVTHKHYKCHRLTRIDAWKEITREMGSGSVKLWRTKWKGLKDNYAKHKKANPPYNDILYKKYKYWLWAKYMTFLDQCRGEGREGGEGSRNHTRIFIYTNEDQDTTQHNAELPDADDANSSVEDQSEQETDMLENMDDSTEVAETDMVYNKRKSHHMNDSTEAAETSKRKKSDDKDEIDGVDHFFLSYAQSFKQLPTRMQIMLKLEIATLFSRYEQLAEDAATQSKPIPVKSEFEFTYTEGE